MSDFQDTYSWGAGCISYVLLQTPQLSVKREVIPPDATEVTHAHHVAQQLFYVLKGKATFWIDDVIHCIAEGNCIYILPGTKHYVANRTGEMLEILVISQPDTTGDRTNC